MYQGDIRIDGVPGSAAGIELFFPSQVDARTDRTFPTGQLRETLLDIDATCIDNGMPVVLLRAADFGLSGNEPAQWLEQNGALMQKIEAIRLVAGERMGLGDVSTRTVPKIILLAAAGRAQHITTRSFSSQRCHRAIGVFAAISVASAWLTPGTLVSSIAPAPTGEGEFAVHLEHPSGVFSPQVTLSTEGKLSGCRVIRTARLLFAGDVMVPDFAHSSR